MKWVILLLASSATALKTYEKPSVYDSILKELYANQKAATQKAADAATEYETEAKTCHKTIEQLKDTLSSLNQAADADATKLQSLADTMADHKMQINNHNAKKNAANDDASKAAQELAGVNQACAEGNQGHRSILKTFRNAIKTYKGSRNNSDAQTSGQAGDAASSSRASAKDGGDALLNTLEQIQGDAKDAYESHIKSCDQDRNSKTSERTDFENEARENESEVDQNETELGNNRDNFNDVNSRNREDLAMIASKQDEYQVTLKNCADDTKENNFDYAEARTLSNQASYIVDMVENMKDTMGFVQVLSKADPLVDIVTKMLDRFPKDKALIQAAAPAAQVDRKNPFVNIMKIIESKIDEVHAANEKDKQEYAACETATREAENSRDGHVNQRSKAEAAFHDSYGNFFKARVDLHGLELQHARTMENFERAKYFRLKHNMENESLFIIAARTAHDMENLKQVASGNPGLISAVEGVMKNLKTAKSAILNSDMSEDEKYGNTRAGYIADIKQAQTVYSDTTSRFSDNKKKATASFATSWAAASKVDIDSTQWADKGSVHEKCEAIKITFEEREAARQQEIAALKESLKAMQNAF